jgi:Xaa-Pro aminopeptidase
MDAQEYSNILTETSAEMEVIFTESEYEQRVASARSRMREEELDALLVTDRCNLFYLTGYYTFGSGNHACLVLPLDGEPTLQVCSLELAAAVVNTWVKDIAFSDWQKQYGEQFGAGEQLAAIVKQKGLETKRLGIEISRRGLLVSVYQALQVHLPGATLVDASALVDEMTYVKSPLELDCMQKAGEYTVAGIEASYAATRPDVTDNDIARAGYDAMIAAGSEFMSVQPIVTSGARSSFLHQTYRRVRIESDDLVFLEYSGCHHRYNAPLMRTIVIGKPTDHMLRTADAAEATLSAIIEALKPGRTFHEVVMSAKKAHAAVDDEIYFFGSYAYGVGIGLPPTWGGSLHMVEGDERVLLPGLTFHLPIAFSVPGKFAVAFSETVAITTDGCEAIVKHPRRLLYA